MFNYIVQGTGPCTDALTSVTVNVIASADAGTALAPVSLCTNENTDLIY